MADDNNTLPPVNENEPTILSVLVDNAAYLSDVVQTLETKIVPDVREIRNTFVTIEKRSEAEQQSARFAQAEASAEAGRLQSEAQAIPQTSFGGSRIGGGLAGLGAAGAGLGAFFLALAGAEAIMSKFGAGDNLKSLLTNLAEGLSAFSSKEFIALGTVLAAGALFGSVGGPEEAIQAGVGMAAMGAGIAGFLIALSGADAVMDSFDGDGSTLKDLLTNVADAIAVLDNDGLIAVGTALAAGAGFATLFGLGPTGKAAIGMTAIGGGIAGFLSALAGADAFADKLGADGDKIGPLMKNVAEGLSAFGTSDFADAAAVIGGTGVAASLFPKTVARGAIVGLGAVGAGIAGFLGSFAVVDYFLEGSNPGSGIRDLLTNLADGLTYWGDLNPDIIMRVGPALGSLSAGLTDFFLGAAGRGVVDFFTFWKDIEETPFNGTIRALVDELKPLEELSLAEVEKLDLFAKGLNSLGMSLDSLGNVNIDVGDIEENVRDIALSVSKTLPVVRVMVEGGAIRENLFDIGNPNIDFGPEGEGGLLNPDLKIDELQTKMQALRGIFSSSTYITNNSIASDAASNIIPNVAQNQVDSQAMLISALSPNVVTPVNITNISNVGNTTDNSSTSVASGGGGSVNVPAGRSYNMDQSFLQSQRPAYI